MERINIRVKAEDLRRVAITCRCKVKSTAEIPEQIAKAFNAHICPSCGTMYRVTLSDKGNVTGIDGRKWLVQRGPSVENVASMNAENILDAMESLGNKEDATTDPTACNVCNGKGYIGAPEYRDPTHNRCARCNGSGKLGVDKDQLN